VKPTHTKSPPGSAALPLTYWLVLVCGLAVLTALRIDEPEKMAPLWVGSALGTVMGQLLARLRLRLWLFGFIVLNSMWIGALMLLPLWSLFETPAQPWASAETCALTFAPAALCGYLCLSERWTLAAFWFPAVLWMLAILDRAGGASLSGTTSWLLLSALGVLLLGFLRARESRRVALWQRHATTPLAGPSNRTVLREAPLGVASQLVWMAGLAGVTMLFTAWVAPHLFQNEKLGIHKVSAASSGAGKLALNGSSALENETCCPENGVAEVEHRRIREYLPLLHGQDDQEATYNTRSARCVACVDGVPVGSTGTTASSAPVAPPPAAPVAPQGASAQGTAAAPAVPPPIKPANPDPTPAFVPPTPKAPPVAAARLRPARPSHAVAQGSSSDGSPLAWLLVMGVVGLMLEVVLRPLRRILTLRHLGRPFWPETVDQRVSNLWQLMLVGLRDAGFRTAPGEQPGDLARRVGIEGMETCATVLERARHGVRVDVADLDAMSRAARSVYRAARGKAGPAARAVSWLRWPMV
jgi:hypothetical protein